MIAIQGCCVLRTAVQLVGFFSALRFLLPISMGIMKFHSQLYKTSHTKCAKKGNSLCLLSTLCAFSWCLKVICRQHRQIHISCRLEGQGDHIHRIIVTSQFYSRSHTTSAWKYMAVALSSLGQTLTPSTMSALSLHWLQQFKAVYNMSM